MQRQVQERLEGRWARLIFVPILGMGIPVAPGLFGPNRYFDGQIRGQPDWLSQPVPRIVLLSTSSPVLTAPYAVEIIPMKR